MTRQISKLTALFVFACAIAQAQDPLFSQFYSTPLVLNPAFAGTTYSPRISATYRNQWLGFAEQGTPVYATYAASYEQFVPAFNSGFGVLVVADDAGGGILKTTSFAANYAYRISTEGFNVRLGVNAGFKQSNIDWDKLVFLDQLDPINGPLDPSGNPNISNEVRPADVSKTLFDVGAGILAYTDKYYGGVSLQHLTTPNEGFFTTNTSLLDGLPLRTTIHAGAEFIVKKGNKRNPSSFVSPNILFAKQGDQGQVNVGAYYNLGLVFFGGWFRHAFGNADAVIGLVGVQYDILKIGYSYDFTLGSGLAGPTGGSHEISLVINFDQSERTKAKRKAERYNDCFQIFR